MRAEQTHDPEADDRLGSKLLNGQRRLLIDRRVEISRFGSHVHDGLDRITGLVTRKWRRIHTVPINHTVRYPNTGIGARGTK